MADVEIDGIIFKYMIGIPPDSPNTQRWEDGMENGESVFEGGDKKIDVSDERSGVGYHAKMRGYPFTLAVLAFYKSAIPDGQARRFKFNKEWTDHRLQGDESYDADVFVVATEKKMSELAQMIREASDILRNGAVLNWDLIDGRGSHTWKSDHTNIEKNYYEYIILPKERETRDTEQASLAAAQYENTPFDEQVKYESAVGALGRLISGHTMTDVRVKITKGDGGYQLVINDINGGELLYSVQVTEITGVGPMKEKSIAARARRKIHQDVMIKIVGNDGPVMRFEGDIQSKFIKALIFAGLDQAKIGTQLQDEETGGASGGRGGGRRTRRRTRRTRRTRRRKSSKKRKSKRRKSSKKRRRR